MPSSSEYNKLVYGGKLTRNVNGKTVTETVGNKEGMQAIRNGMYESASILKNNKFFVGLYGDYVLEALTRMKADVKSISSDKNFNHPKIFGANKNTVALQHFNQFTHIHKTANNEVEMKWTAKEITLPTVQSKIESNINIDTTKTINYPLIKGTTGVGKIVITVVEDRRMTMYHFLNTLINRFYEPKILKPRSSFQKLSMYAVILSEQAFGDGKNYSVEHYPVQVFEFNSIVPTGITGLSFSHEVNPKKVEYTLTLEAPNTFQSSFKTLGDFRGLRDNTSDQVFKRMSERGVDVGGMNPTTNDYQRVAGDGSAYVFEVDMNKLTTPENKVDRGVIGDISDAGRR